MTNGPIYANAILKEETCSRNQGVGWHAQIQPSNASERERERVIGEEEKPGQWLEQRHQTHFL